MSDSDDHTPIRLAESVIAPSDAVLGDVVEAMRQMGAVRENEIVTEMDIEIRVNEQVRVTDYTVQHPNDE